MSLARGARITIRRLPRIVTSYRLSAIPLPAAALLVDKDHLRSRLRSWILNDMTAGDRWRLPLSPFSVKRIVPLEMASA